MSEQKPTKRAFTKNLWSGLAVGNLIFSCVLLLLILLPSKSKVGYVDMEKVINALVTDIHAKNQAVMEIKSKSLQDKQALYEKKKKEFERKKARGKATDNSKLESKLEKLEEEIQDEAKALDDDFGARMSNDFTTRMKDLMEAIESTRTKHGFSMIIHGPPMFSMDPRIASDMVKTVCCDDKHDVSQEVLDKLGLKASDSTKG